MSIARRWTRGACALAVSAVAGGAPALAIAENSASAAHDAQIAPRLVEWRRDIHQHPELGNREFRTGELVAAHLKSLGLEVRTGVAHTGVTALLKGGKPGPRIALRADMDALPVTEQSALPFASKATTEFNGEKVGVMHACGHDAHTAILMGVAQALAARRADLPGEVLFVFQPAEEGAPIGEEGGAALMLKEGIFERFKPAAVFGLHVWSALPAGTVGYHAGPFLAAADRFTIVVHGRQTHGAKPWAGVDPIVAAADIVLAAQGLVSRETDITTDPLVVSVGSFRAGNRYNIIPDRAELVGTVRSFDPKLRERTLARLRETAEHTALAHGATAEFADVQTTPVTINDATLTARMARVLERVAGSDRAVAIAPVTVAEDFGELARRAPGFYFFVGATPAGQDPLAAPANHSPLFYLDESALDLGFRSLLAVALDFLDGGSAAR